MQIPLTYPVLFLAIAIIVGGFTAIITFWQKANQPANRFLALLLLSASLWLLVHFFETAGVYAQSPDFYFKPILYSFAFGPLIYFYINFLVDRKAHFKRCQLLHFIPVLLQAGLYWFLSFQPYEYKRWFWFEIHRPYTQRVEFVGTFLSLFIYLLLSVRFLRHYQTWLKENESEVSRINLRWLKVLLLIIFIWSAQWLLEIILREFFDSYYEYDFSAFILTVLIIFTAIGSILQVNIRPLAVNSLSANKPAIDKTILQVIQKRMEEQKAYLNPKLNLKEFAQSIKLPARTVSEHINHGLNISFIDFVNRYRVEEVKRRLQTDDRKRYTILGIALESGFNSKATFHRVFKQFTGEVPGGYGGK